MQARFHQANPGIFGTKPEEDVKQRQSRGRERPTLAYDPFFRGRAFVGAARPRGFVVHVDSGLFTLHRAPRLEHEPRTPILHGPYSGSMRSQGLPHVVEVRTEPLTFDGKYEQRNPASLGDLRTRLGPF